MTDATQTQLHLEALQRKDEEYNAQQQNLVSKIEAYDKATRADILEEIHQEKRIKELKYQVSDYEVKERAAFAAEESSSFQIARLEAINSQLEADLAAKTEKCIDVISDNQRMKLEASPKRLHQEALQRKDEEYNAQQQKLTTKIEWYNEMAMVDTLKEIHQKKRIKELKYQVSDYEVKEQAALAAEESSRIKIASLEATNTQLEGDLEATRKKYLDVVWDNTRLKLEVAMANEQITVTIKLQ